MCAVIALVAMLSIGIVYVADEGARSSAAGEIEISSVEDLQKIGNDASYPLNGNYIQTADIDFVAEYNKLNHGALSSRGLEVEITATIDSTGVVFKLVDATNNHWVNIQAYAFGDAIVPSSAAQMNLTISHATSGFDFSKPMMFVAKVSINSVNYAMGMEIPADFMGTITKKGFANGNFTPIGSLASQFTGSYNGGGYTIYGLEAIAFDAADATSSLFRYALDATLSDIHLEDGIHIAVANSGSAVASGFIGYSGRIIASDLSNANGIVSFIVGQGTNLGTATSGGLIGSNAVPLSGDNVPEMIHSYNLGTIAGYASGNGGVTQTRVGGLFGSTAEGTIGHSYNAGSVSSWVHGVGGYAANAYVGGIAGSYTNTVFGPMHFVYNTGAVSSWIWHDNSSTPNSSTYTGGLVGWIANNEASIENSFNTGPVDVTSLTPNVGTNVKVYTGGIAGYAAKTTTGNVRIFNTYNAGELAISAHTSSSLLGTGGIAGYVYSTYILNSYFIYSSTNPMTLYGLAGDSNSRLFGCDNDDTNGLDDLRDQATYNTLPVGDGSMPDPVGWEWTIWGIQLQDTGAYWINNGLPYFIGMTPTVIDAISGPDDATAAAGGNATFEVSASPMGVTYQWQVRDNIGGTWVSIYPNGTFASLTVGATSGMDGYQYRCVIYNNATFDHSKSRIATLTVVDSLPVTITTQPQDVEVEYLRDATFTIGLSTMVGVTYQWQVNMGTGWGNVPSGGTSSTYTEVGTSLSMDGYEYRCNVTYSGITITSDEALLTVTWIKVGEIYDILAIGNDVLYPVDGYYIVTNNFDCTPTYGLEMVPIGTLAAPFTGKFNGNGKILSNWQVETYTLDDGAAGLFGYVSGNAEIYGITLSGGACSAEGYLASDMHPAGGIVGMVTSLVGGTVSIHDCVNLNDVRSEHISGGIVGQVSSNVIIRDCVNEGDVLGVWAAGGIVGSASGTVTIADCSNGGGIEAISASGYAYAGGIAGFLTSVDPDGIVVSDCTNTTVVSASALNLRAAGIAGFARNATMTDCINSGKIEGDSTLGADATSYVGGIVGRLESSLIDGCINEATGTIGMVAEDSLGNNGLRYWLGGIAGDMVYGSSIKNGSNSAPVSASVPVGTTYLYIGGIVGCMYQGTSILDCVNSGDVTGGNAVVSGLFVYAGGIAGVANGTSSKGVTISNCDAIGQSQTAVNVTSIAANARVGGIVGYGCYATVTGCDFNGAAVGTGGSIASSVSAASVRSGGIAGYLEHSYLTACTSSGSVSAMTLNSNGLPRAGGIVGSMVMDTYVVGCTAYGEVSANSGIQSSGKAYAGGIAGLTEGTISGCTYASSASRGTVISVGFNSGAGGLAGTVNLGSVVGVAYADVIAQFTETIGKGRAGVGAGYVLTVATVTSMGSVVTPTITPVPLS